MDKELEFALGWDEVSVLRWPKDFDSDIRFDFNHCTHRDDPFFLDRLLKCDPAISKPSQPFL